MALINKKALSNLVDKTKEATEKIKDNAVAFIDQNNDGELNAEDFARVKDKAKVLAADSKDKARELAADGKELLEAARLDLERKKYNPISYEEFANNDFELPRIIRLLETNPYKDKETCKDAVGFNSSIGGKHVLELIKGKYDLDKVELYPNIPGMIYLRNPYKENMYVSINEYFEYIKEARVTELVEIANKLGAKHIKITYLEDNETIAVLGVENSETAGEPGIQVKEGKKCKLSASNSKVLKIEADKYFEGNKNPIKPDLVYYKGNLTVENIVNNYLGNNPTKSDTHRISCDIRRDISLELAADIDVVLKKLSMKGNTTVTAKVEDENKRFFAYEIEF